ncbi:putative disease resistance protein At3g14460 [Eucalyptus grandis]|uniref:putative disease resistance protein At3g14460 n=1 Tax=Eucalyptus grandis TaxID=71139 RepID=UPI00192EA771|nr:putative disease resistance protein At3g14460 [Eucalyptus grandis]
MGIISKYYRTNTCEEKKKKKKLQQDGRQYLLKVTDSPMDIGGIVLGSFLASSFQVLFDKLASSALGYAQHKGISTTLPKVWKEKLFIINAVLADAEDKELSGNHQVKLWLDKVKDLAYDMEDLLDEFEIKAAHIELEAESSTSKGLGKWKFSFLANHPHSCLKPRYKRSMTGWKRLSLERFI